MHIEQFVYEDPRSTHIQWTQFWENPSQSASTNKRQSKGSIPALSAPFAELLPALARHQAIIIIALTPNIVALDIRLIALRVGTPLPNSFRHRVGAELGQVWLGRAQNGSRQIPWTILGNSRTVNNIRSEAYMTTRVEDWRPTYTCSPTGPVE